MTGAGARFPMRMMMLKGLLAILLAAVLPLGADARSATDEAWPEGRRTWIVQFEEPPLASFRAADADRVPKSLAATSPLATGASRLDVDAPASRAYRAHLAERRGALLGGAAKALGRAVQPSRVYEVAFNGVAIELDADEAERLRATPGVRSVTPDFHRRMLTDAGPAWIRADQVWSASPPLGNRGEGVVIGIIDSGIHAGHPAFAAIGPKDGYDHANPLGRLFGLCSSAPASCNDKLIGIYDFSDEGARDGSDVTGHGTHVAGIAAGNLLDFSIALPSGSVPRPVSGVAPHANLISYKACRQDDPDTDATEACALSWLLDAIDQAVADGVDIINYSIGGIDKRGPWHCGSRRCADEQAMLAAYEAGVLPVVAAGNEGPAVGTVTSPGEAPWVLSVANASHDRVVANRLLDLSGGNSAAPGMGTLVGVGQTSGTTQRPIIIPDDFPGCGIGTHEGLDDNGNPDGSTNPWASDPGNRFNGEIVVCLRGTHARIAKSDNVRREGAGGFVLVNTAAEAESVVADAHSLPGVHLGFRDGSALRAWLSSGSGHRARIEGTSVLLLPERADVLSSSSGRGPAGLGTWLLPDVTAPGSSIIAAAHSGSGTAVKSGTSMASPHVAGAAALLKSAHPDWTPADLASALTTTARPSARLEDAITPATVFDQGAGVVDAAAALRAGLSFRISAAQYSAANPLVGGDSRALNEPALLHDACFRSCTLRRTVTDLAGGGDWRVVAELPDGAAVEATPSQFSLGAGASREIVLQIDVDDPALAGGWVDGRVRFERVTDDDVSDAAIPLFVHADPGPLPQRVSLQSAGERGQSDLALSGLVALPDARFGATALAEVATRERTVGADPTRSDPYDSTSSGVVFTVVEVPSAAAGVPLRLVVDGRSSSATDVDLFVGEDANGDGQPELSEERCRSTGPGAEERCVLDLQGSAVARSYWVVAQNHFAGSGGSDPLVIESAVVDMRPAADSPLVVTGPGDTATGEAFRVRASWDLPALRGGTPRRGYLLLGALPGRLGHTAQVLVDLRKDGDQASATVLVPGQPRSLWLPPGSAQDRLVVEVPPNASALRLSTTGAGEIDLYAAHVDSPSSPAIAAAPARSAADAVAATAGASETLVLDGSALRPGRWYVTPVNSGSGMAMGQLTATIEYAAARVQPRFGAWFNPARSGAGVFLYPVGNDWALFWYTFLQDGTPTWYLGNAPAPAAQQGSWTVPLYRYAWNGSAASATQVGEAVLSLGDAGRLTFGWNLDGESGSEPYVFIDAGGCPDGGSADLTGSWFQPDLSGYGFSINVHAGLETNASYFYDGQGVARWLFGASDGSGDVVLSQYQGPCPLCEYSAPTTTEVGAFARDYTGDTEGSASLEAVLVPPLQGSWSSAGPIRKLTDGLGCD